jgi:hypothetical protein
VIPSNEAHNCTHVACAGDFDGINCAEGHPAHTTCGSSFFSLPIRDPHLSTRLALDLSVPAILELLQLSSAESTNSASRPRPFTPRSSRTLSNFPQQNTGRHNSHGRRGTYNVWIGAEEDEVYRNRVWEAVE